MQLHPAHPFNRFYFCPRCGSPGFTSNSIKSMACNSCGGVWYFNLAPAVIGLVFNARNELLLTRRRHEPAAGMLDLPGGFVDAGETSEAALVREVWEETGLTVAAYHYLRTYTNEYVYDGLLYYTLDSAWVCRVDDFSGLCPADDVTSIHFQKVEDICTEDIGLASVRRLIKGLQQDSGFPDRYRDYL